MVVNFRRPKAIVFDILGTASKSGFLERVLFPFLELNLDHFITAHWMQHDFIKLYNRILEQSIEFNKREPATPIVLPHENSQAKASLIAFINFVTENGVNSPAVTKLRFKVWFEGYQQSKIRTPIYSDVPNRMREWFAEGVKFYVFSNTWVEAQKALLKNTNHGDLTNLISGHYDNDFGMLNEVDSWRRLCTDIRETPGDVLFLTKSAMEARAASDAGLGVVLVLTHRHNVRAVSHDDRRRFAFVRTLNDLIFGDGTADAGGSISAASPSMGRPGSTVIPTALTRATNSAITAATTATAASSSRQTSATYGVGTSEASGSQPVSNQASTSTSKPTSQASSSHHSTSRPH